MKRTIKVFKPRFILSTRNTDVKTKVLVMLGIIMVALGDIAAMYHRATDDMPGYDTLNADYGAAGFANYGDEAQMWGAFAYDAAQIIFAAIDRADSANPADIRDEIAATTNYPGVVGTYEGFDNKGDVIPQWAWIERYQNGQWAPPVTPIYLPIVLKGDGGRTTGD